jgi:predicted GNAT family acetyltransferase
MIIQHKGNDNRGIFFIEDEGDVIAQIVYANGGEDVIIIEHTEVEKDMRGQDIGFELVHRTVEHARMHGLKVSPVCPFAKAVFDKKPDFRDVLA